MLIGIQILHHTERQTRSEEFRQFREEFRQLGILSATPSQVMADKHVQPVTPVFLVVVYTSIYRNLP